MKEILTINETHLNAKYFILLLLFAYIFSMAVRMIWVEQFNEVEGFKWNNEIMINTNDGYYYAEGARDNIAGFHQDNDMSAVETPLSKVTSFLAQFLPVSFETLILYLSAFLGSLLVIPIMLMARSLNQDIIGFVAALVASIAWSYYNRTMIGYYDTDMLVVVLSSLVLSSLVLAAVFQKNIYLVFIPLSIIFNDWWYPSSSSVNIAFLLIVLTYTVVFERKNIYFYIMILFIAITLFTMPLWMKLLLLSSIYVWFNFSNMKNMKIIFIFVTMVLVYMLFTGSLDPIISQLKGYVFRSDVSSEVKIGLNYFSVMQTVREASQIPFETFANRISGHTITFVLSTVGYFLLALRYRVMWLALPMIGLGFLALKGGLRFTVFAVPINALGIGFLIVYVSQKIPNNFKYLLMSILTALVLYPNIVHVVKYKVPTVFNNQEIVVLDSLRKIADREDYVLAWWDYGYPLRYYCDMKTLIDGAKHDGGSNYPVSFALLEEQKSSAKMARLAVEYTESAYKEKRPGSYLQMMMEDNGISDPSVFFSSLHESNVKMPEKTRDVYYYLPLRMLNILPTVALFSNLDLATGTQRKRPYFYQSSRFKQVGAEMNLGGNVRLDMQSKVVRIGNQVLPVNTFYTTEYGEDGHVNVKAQLGNMMGAINVIYMKSYHRFLVLDHKMLNSTFIQLLVLENYDKNLFELVVSNPYAKVYKLKI